MEMIKGNRMVENKNVFGERKKKRLKKEVELINEWTT